MMCNGNCGQGRQCDCVPDFEWNEPTEIEGIASMAASLLMIVLIIASITGIVMLYV
jgi:hypothetical protein